MDTRQFDQQDPISKAVFSFLVLSGALDFSFRIVCNSEIALLNSRYADIFQQDRNLASVLQILQVEHDMETVVKVLQPGPLGIIEHKFSLQEIAKANSTVRKAVENWKRNAIIERNRPILKDYLN